MMAVLKKSQKNFDYRLHPWMNNELKEQISESEKNKDENTKSAQKDPKKKSKVVKNDEEEEEGDA